MGGEIQVIGHRGWPTRYPDNTLSGLLAAAAVTDRVEVDVRRSSDGKLVLSHDAGLGGHVVSETPWSTLCNLDLGDGHHPALLDEALAALPGVAAQLEVKNTPGGPGYEPDHRLALETAERARPGDMITGFNRETLSLVHRVYPEVPTGLAITTATDLDEAVRHCLEAGHVALVPDNRLITGQVDHEVSLFPWTVNDPRRAVELVDLGVAGIITDDPGLIVETLRRDP